MIVCSTSHLNNETLGKVQSSHFIVIYVNMQSTSEISINRMIWFKFLH